MSIANKDEVEGKIDQATGWVKEKVGDATDNDRLRVEGQVRRADGESKEAWGKIKRKVGDAVDAVADAIKK